MSMYDQAQARKTQHARHQQVANTIMQQLGGNKFVAMTGAKRVTCFHNGVGFQLPNAAQGINWVEITLNELDFYNVGFYTVTPAIIGKTAVKTVDDLDVEQMVDCFKDTTGLAISL